MFLCITKKNLVFGVSQIAKLAQVVGRSWTDGRRWTDGRSWTGGRWSLVDTLKRLKISQKKALDNNILLVRGYKTPELYCQHDTIGTFYHFPSLQYVS